MDLESITISNTTDSITLSADTVISPLTWTTVTGTAIPNYTTVSTCTTPIQITTTNPSEIYTKELTLMAPVKNIVKKEEKLDPRIVKINIEIKELKNKTSFNEIKEYVPNKVYGFKFGEKGKEYKTICSDEDTFSLEFAFFLALAKWFSVTNLTTEGYIYQATQLSYNKNWIKEVKNGIKLFHKLQEKKALEEQIKAEKKRRHDKLVQKKIEKKNRKKDEQIKIIRTAIEASKQKF